MHLMFFRAPKHPKNETKKAIHPTMIRMYAAEE